MHLCKLNAKKEVILSVQRSKKLILLKVKEHKY
jgi:hypothetical protein